MDKWEIYQDERGEWRWRRIASNGRIVGASSQGYRNRADCEANAKRDEASDTWEFYLDERGEWRWRRTASNGRIVGASSQGYANKADCVANARRNGYAGN